MSALMEPTAHRPTSALRLPWESIIEPLIEERRKLREERIQAVRDHGKDSDEARALAARLRANWEALFGAYPTE